MAIRVLLADDHTMLRQLVRKVLEREPHIEVVAEADNGADALKLALELQPDVTVMDIGMPGVNGINATRMLVSGCPNLRVLALSGHTDRHFIEQMLKAGAHGYIVKTCGIEEVIRGIGVVCDGGTYLCQEAANAMVERFCAHRTDATRIELAPREIEVLTLLAKGKTSKEIGATLHIAPGTVDVHRRNIMRKLGLHSVAELTHYAVQEQLIAA